MEHMYFQGTYPTQSQTDSTLTGTYVLSRHISDSITNRKYTRTYVLSRHISDSITNRQYTYWNICTFKAHIRFNHKQRVHLMEHMYFQGTYPTQSQTDSTLNGTYVLSRDISDLITNRQYT